MEFCGSLQGVLQYDATFTGRTTVYLHPFSIVHTLFNDSHVMPCAIQSEYSSVLNNQRFRLKTGLNSSINMFVDSCHSDIMNIFLLSDIKFFVVMKKYNKKMTGCMISAAWKCTIA